MTYVKHRMKASYLPAFFRKMSAFFVLTSIFLTTDMAVSEDFFNSNFTEMPGGVKTTGKWTIENNSLQSYGEGMSVLKIEDLDIRDFSLDTRFRFVSGEDRDRHGGFLFYGENGTMRIFFRTGQAVVLITREGETVQSAGHRFSRNWEEKPDSPWNDIRAVYKDGSVELNINKALVNLNLRKYLLGKISRMEVYGYRCNVALDHLYLSQVTPFTGRTERKESDGGPAFYASFDGSLDAVLSTGEVVKPEQAAGITFVEGLKGRAVYIGDVSEGKKPATLSYGAGDLFKGNTGTVMFWFSPDWYGRADDSNFPWYHILNFMGQDNQPKLNVFMWHWLRADMAREGLSGISLEHRCRSSFFKNDWWHFAIVWNDKGWNRLYLNGFSYEHGLGSNRAMRRVDVSMNSVSSILVGSLKQPRGTMRKANGAFAEFKIYKRPLSDEEIMGEYRKYMPADITMERRFIPAGLRDKLAFTVSQGETHTLPGIKTVAAKAVPLDVKVSLVEKESERTILEKKFKATLRKAQNFEMEIPPLKEGEYIVRWQIGSAKGMFQHSIPLEIYAAREKPVSIEAAVRTGEPFIRLNCAEESTRALFNAKPEIQTGPGGKQYLQAGRNKFDRFGFEIEFPEEYVENNAPVMMEIDWPDDVARSMGLYMYPESKGKHHRDRLGGGIQSGDEFPLTGKMVTTRYLFYPGLKRYLFEARTMVPGMPAAVAQVRFSPLLEPLSKMEINRPAGYEARQLGHTDEDQSFEINLNNDDSAERKSNLYQVKIIRRLADYFDYTGQSVIAYPILRYAGILYDHPAKYYSMGRVLTDPGFVFAFLDIFRQRNMQMYGTVNLYSIPELSLRPDRYDEMEKQDCFSFDKEGRNSGVRMPNPVHPFVRENFIKHLTGIINRYGSHPSFAGIDLWEGAVWTFQGLDFGYDDYTVSLFEKETGVKVPAGSGASRFNERWKYLAGPAREKWMRWRAGKTTEIIKIISRILAEKRPDLKLHITVGIPGLAKTESPAEADTERLLYETYSLDLSALKKLGNVETSPMRNYTDYRWQRHWDNKETIYDDVLYDPSFWQIYRKNGQASAWSFARYFESFNDSLKPEVYGGYFQSADVKPWGRYFLKEWAFSLAALDSNVMLIGGQPIGTLGREDETREFARAYCALPAKPFNTVENVTGPVTVRILNTGAGTYAYFVNLSWSEVTAEVHFSKKTAGTELGNGDKLPAAVRMNLHLEPYQLRSFLLDDKSVRIDKVETVVPQATTDYLFRVLKELRNAAAQIKSSGFDTGDYDRTLDNTEKALEKKEIDSVMRTLFSKKMRTLRAHKEADEKGFIKKQMEMAARGHFAVDCGSTTYYTASDGTLFAPDRPFREGLYGYVGDNSKSVGRSVANIKNVKDPHLYTTEAYDVDGYRFTVPNGAYKVRLYLKVGYERSAKPGAFVMSLDIQGKRVAENMDVFVEAENDFDRGFIKEFHNIKVENGILEIAFSVPEGISPTARLCNAIEVIAEKK